MALVKLAADTDLGPLAHEAGGQLLNNLLPLLQARAGAALKDTAAMQAAVGQLAGCSAARIAALLLHVGSNHVAAAAACSALFCAVKERGHTADLALVAAALSHVAGVSAVDIEALWKLAVEAVEAVHQRSGAPLAACDSAVQWLVVGAQRLKLPRALCERVLACVASEAHHGEAAATAVEGAMLAGDDMGQQSQSQDSMLGSLADEMGV